ncbi:MAG: DUF2652 domain-containing protein [Bacteroidia bacterium]
MADTLFFIPDISGFTEFVHQTEVRHSHHIVGELLELIIDQDQLGLVAAEIEGDAILFYKNKDIPSAAAIIQQAERMFMAFHKHLAYYNQRRVCDCGACRTASGLSLKIVVHRGDAEMLKVKQFVKPYGGAVIVAHRLLKNAIPNDEYVLMTEPVYQHSSLPELNKEFPWAQFTEGSDAYMNIGDTPYCYIPLGGLHERIPMPPPPPSWTKTGAQITSSQEIACSSEHVYQVLTDLARRADFQKGVRRIDHKKGEVNRVGAEHICILPVGQATFETIRAPQQSPGTKTYAESTASVPFVKEFTQLFSISDCEKGTKVTVNAFLQPSNWIGKRLIPFYKKQLSKGLDEVLFDLKELCEREAELIS